MSSPSLAELQRLFFASIARVPGDEAAFEPAVVEAIAPSATLAPAARLAIYGDMYWARLRDCLREDFPQLAARLGDERFDAVVREYLAAAPSRHPSVRHVGDRLPEFLATRADAAGAVVDLARLERARLDVFDAPDAAPLAAADLAAVHPDAWGALRFRLVPACERLRCGWPAHRLWDDPAAEVDAEPTVLRVWREGFRVYHAPMAAAEAAALEAVAAGEPFAAVCEILAGDRPLDEAAPDAVGRLARWIEDGLLLRR